MKKNLFRFFVENKKDNQFELDQKTLKHIKVVRIKENDEIICNYKNTFYLCKLVYPFAKIIKKLAINNEFDAKLGIAICLTKHKSLKLSIEKAVELGATDIHLVISKNSQKINQDFQKMITKYQKIILASSKQSFRNKIPILHPISKIDLILNLEYQHKFVAYEHCKQNSKIYCPLNAVYLVGPEGGFSNQEIANLIASNWVQFSLGKRILRAETAVITTLSYVNYCNLLN